MADEQSAVWDYLPELLETIDKAQRKHPTYCKTDIVHAVALVAEEAGEAMQAANNAYHHGGPVDAVKKELLQTAATIFRCLDFIEQGGK